VERFLGLLGEDGPDPATVDAAVRAARTRSPLVAALPEDEVRRHVRALVGAALTALAAGDPELTDLRAVVDRGRELGIPADEPAAAVLHVHPDTVKYRLRRFHRLTGERLDRLPVPETAHRWWALRTFLAR